MSSNMSYDNATLEIDGKIWFYHLRTSKETPEVACLEHSAYTPHLLAMRYSVSPTSYLYTSFDSQEEKVEYVLQNEAAEEDHYYEVVTTAPLNKIHFSFTTLSPDTATSVVNKIITLLHEFYSGCSMTLKPNHIRIHYHSPGVYRVTDVNHYFTHTHLCHIARLIIDNILFTLPTGSVEFKDEYGGGDLVALYESCHLFRASGKEEEYSLLVDNNVVSYPLPLPMVPQEKMKAALERSVLLESIITYRSGFDMEHSIVSESYHPPPSSVYSSEESYAAAEEYFYRAHPSYRGKFIRQNEVLFSDALFYCDACKVNHLSGWNVRLRWDATVHGFTYWCEEATAGSRYFEVGRPWPQLCCVVSGAVATAPGFISSQGIQGNRVPPCHPITLAGCQGNKENDPHPWYIPYSEGVKHPRYLAYRSDATVPLSSYASTLKIVNAKGTDDTDECIMYRVMEKLYDLGTKMSEDYKAHGNRVLLFRTADPVNDVKVKIKVALPSLSENKGNARYLSLAFDCVQILTGTFEMDQMVKKSLKTESEKTAELKRNLEDRKHFWATSGPYYPLRPCVIPFFRGEKVPLLHGSDINVSAGFPSNPTLASGDYATLKKHFQRVRILVKHGFSAGCSVKKRVFMAWNAYILTHLNDPQTKKAFLNGGPQGCGKSLWIKFLAAIYGTDLWGSARMFDLYGNFNSTIKGRLMVTVDEPSISTKSNTNDNSAEIKNRMKEIIDGCGYIPITGKCENPITMKNLVNIYMATNNFNVSGVDSEDQRRYIIYRARSIGETSSGVIITASTRSFSDAVDLQGNPVVLAPEDTTDAMIRRFFAPLFALVDTPSFAHDFVAYLIGYGKKHDTTFIRTYEQDYMSPDREEMLFASACSTEEFLSKIPSSDFHFKTSAYLRDRSDTEAINRYYVSMEHLYAEYRAWFKASYDAGKAMSSRAFGMEATAYSRSNPELLTMHTQTKNGGDHRIQITVVDEKGKSVSKKLPAGVVFATQALLVPKQCDTQSPFVPVREVLPTA